jgi:hypothetical protein
LTLPAGSGKRTGDLDVMVNNRSIRALVLINPIGFFYSGGKPEGIQDEALEEFERFANQQLNTGRLPVKVVFLPMRPDQLEAALNQGLRDVIAQGIVITPQREQRVRPNRIVRLRKKAQDDGLDPNKWFGNVELEVAQNIGEETVTYGGNIYKYYVAYKLTVEQKQRKQAMLASNKLAARATAKFESLESGYAVVEMAVSIIRSVVLRMGVVSTELRGHHCHRKGLAQVRRVGKPPVNANFALQNPRARAPTATPTRTAWRGGLNFCAWRLAPRARAVVGHRQHEQDHEEEES